MTVASPALQAGLTIEVSPGASSGIEIELQTGGYTNPRLFPGFRAILTGTKQRYIGLADNGKTALPSGAKILGLDLPANSQLVRVTWDKYPASSFLFARTPEQQLIAIEPAAGVDLNAVPKSLGVRGFANLTAVVIEGDRFMKRLRGKAVPALPGKTFHVVRFPKIEEGLRVMVPSLQFLRVSTTSTTDTLKEGKKSRPKLSTEMVATSSHCSVKLPGDALGEQVSPRGYPKGWLTFATLPSDEDTLVFLDTGVPQTDSPLYGVHHLRTLLAAASS